MSTTESTERIRVVSLNVGLPRLVTWRGRTVTSAIIKTPVDGEVFLGRRNLNGDGQADRRVHGGTSKAVYCYPHEHYSWWREQLAGQELPIGMFGENLTIEGLGEDSVCVGDELSIGTARGIVTQPRIPCHKLAIRFESDSIVRRFLDSGRSGFFLSVRSEGKIRAGYEIRITARDPHRVSVADINRLNVRKSYEAEDIAIVKNAMNIAALPNRWKERFRRRAGRKG